MTSLLSTRLRESAQKLMTKSPIIHWREVVLDIGELKEAEREEAQQEGLHKLAKWAVKAASPDPTSLFGWARMNMPSSDGARVTAAAVTIEDYDWQIAQANKAISNFTKLRDRLIAERDALFAKGGRHE